MKREYLECLGRECDGRPFPQLSLLDTRRFDSMLRQRGISLWPRGIEHLRKKRVLYPVRTDPDSYHPFQIWLVHGFVSQMKIDLLPQFSYVGFDWALAFRNLVHQWSQMRTQITGFSKRREVIDFYRLLPLLFFVECYYLPTIRGRFVGLDSESLAKWEEWRATVDLGSYMGKSSLSISEVKAWQNRLLFDAYSIDPAKKWYLLVRSTSYEQRNKLEGQLRLAHDIYEIAEMLRRYVSDVAGESLCKEWDPTGHPDTPWIQRLYYINEVKFGNATLTRRLLRQYGLETSFMVNWLVEGDTEEAFISKYCELLGVSHEAEHISLLNFKGETNFQKHFKAIDQVLEKAKKEECFVTLTFDAHPRTRERVKELLKQQLITLRYLINDPDFERHNFTTEQLVEVVTQMSNQSRLPIKASVEQLVTDLNRRFSKVREPVEKAINTVLHTRKENYFVAKGKAWGEALAVYLYNRREKELMNGVYDESALVPIEKQILSVLRTPGVDYKLSVDNANFNDLEGFG